MRADQFSQCFAYSGYLANPSNKPMSFEDWQREVKQPLPRVSTNPATFIHIGVMI